MTAALENSILAKVIAAIQQTVFLRDVQIPPEPRFAEDLGLDSLVVTIDAPADVLRYVSRRFFADSDLALAD